MSFLLNRGFKRISDCSIERSFRDLYPFSNKTFWPNSATIHLYYSSKFPLWDLYFQGYCIISGPMSTSPVFICKSALRRRCWYVYLKFTSFWSQVRLQQNGEKSSLNVPLDGMQLANIHWLIRSYHKTPNAASNTVSRTQKNAHQTRTTCRCRNRAK